MTHNPNHYYTPYSCQKNPSFLAILITLSLNNNSSVTVIGQQDPVMILLLILCVCSLQWSAVNSLTLVGSRQCISLTSGILHQRLFKYMHSSDCSFITEVLATAFAEALTGIFLYSYHLPHIGHCNLVGTIVHNLGAGGSLTYDLIMSAK